MSNISDLVNQDHDTSIRDSDIMMLVFLLTTGPLGVTLNLAFIIFTCCKQELRKDYTWFLIGISASNIMYCINMAIPQVIVIILNVDQSSIFCQVVGVIVLVNGVSAVCIQPMLAVNRFVSLFYSHLLSKYFSRSNIVLLLFIMYVVCIALTTMLQVMGDVGRLGNSICGPKIQEMAISHVSIFVGPIFVAHAISIYCGYRILFLIRNHQKAAMRLDRGARIQDAKDIFRLIVIELGVPICFETPALISCLLSGQIYVPQMIIVFTVGLFLTHPLLDPVIIVLVMKPYRVCAKEIWCNFWEINVVQTFTVTPEMIGSIN